MKTKLKDGVARELRAWTVACMRQRKFRRFWTKHQTECLALFAERNKHLLSSPTVKEVRIMEKARADAL